MDLLGQSMRSVSTGWSSVQRSSRSPLLLTVQ